MSVKQIQAEHTIGAHLGVSKERLMQFGKAFQTWFDDAMERKDEQFCDCTVAQFVSSYTTDIQEIAVFAMMAGMFFERMKIKEESLEELEKIVSAATLNLHKKSEVIN